MTTTNQRKISQELFDETLAENEEVFELGGDEAVKETIAQLTKQYGDASCFGHLCLHHPNSRKGQQERQERRTFLANLALLDQCVTSDGKIELKDTCLNSIRQAMENIRASCSYSDSFLTLFQQESAMYTFMSFLNVVSSTDETKNEDRVTILGQTLTTLITVLQKKVELRDLFVAWEGWTRLFVEFFLDNIKIKTLLVKLAFEACRACQANKVLWMRTKSTQALLDGLADNNTTEPNDAMVDLWTASCLLITVLCKYDDFRSVPNNNSPTVSSAHEHVMEFARAGAVPILVQVLKNSTTRPKLTAASLSALRVMAIQDEIVQTMVATGVLDLVQDTLKEAENKDVLCAAIGLARNLSANDEIKTTLCASLPYICNAMQVNPKHALLQEHGCGTLASMALRKPRNAQQIVDNDGHARILTAMKLHPNKVAVQRQGALAVRNVCSRQSSRDIQQQFLDLGAEQVLREVAGGHQGSVDEAYAALKELKCDVSMLTIQDNGATTSNQTEVFGQVQSSFRPVLEPSQEMENLNL